MGLIERRPIWTISSHTTRLSKKTSSFIVQKAPLVLTIPLLCLKDLTDAAFTDLRVSGAFELLLHPPLQFLETGHVLAKLMEELDYFVIIPTGRDYLVRA